MDEIWNRPLSPWNDPAENSPVRSSRDRRWLARAAKAAGQADGKWRVGCILVRGGSVLAAAANSTRNDVRILDDRPWLSSEHAEIAALRLAANPAGATAYVARIGADGTWRHAQPCRRCAHTLTKAGVTMIWTTDPAYVHRHTVNTER